MRHPIPYRGILEDFKPPEDPHAKIWRFMSFAKYISFLERRCLFFARASTLGDPFEGAKTRKTIELRDKVMPFLRSRHLNPEVRSDLTRDVTFISCWHLNEDESQGMWKLYIEGSEGVAIQSRFETLAACLRANSKWKDKVYLGCVRYIDYEVEKMRDGFIGPFIYKRSSFRHENEVRAIIFPRRQPKAELGLEELEAGKSVAVDVNSLVEAVYSSPYAPSWFHDLVSCISKKYELLAPVRHSHLKASPVF